MPLDSPRVEAARVLLEVRDVTLLDVASEVMTSCTLERVAIAPNRLVTFELDVPESEPERSLSLRVHVDITGSGQVLAGDLLTTASQSVASEGDLDLGEIPIHVV